MSQETIDLPVLVHPVQSEEDQTIEQAWEALQAIPSYVEQQSAAFACFVDLRGKEA